MDEEAVNLIVASFILGLRVSQSINNLPDPDEIRYLALLETLERLVAGEEVLWDSIAQLKRQRPEINDLAETQAKYDSLRTLIASTVLKKLRPAGK
ncbi:hypothetical protein NA78x_000323 [Anatilimnocola sp. NA78]|uniref:hypothetical protein n=1 Tax=Anatilimnocola sp. NA78 TaxID=3415683 RepID=UPI003CE55B6C